MALSKTWLRPALVLAIIVSAICCAGADPAIPCDKTNSKCIVNEGFSGAFPGDLEWADNFDASNQSVAILNWTTVDTSVETCLGRVRDTNGDIFSYSLGLAPGCNLTMTQTVALVPGALYGFSVYQQGGAGIDFTVAIDGVPYWHLYLDDSYYLTDSAFLNDGFFAQFGGFVSPRSPIYTATKASVTVSITVTATYNLTNLVSPGFSMQFLANSTKANKAPKIPATKCANPKAIGGECIPWLFFDLLPVLQSGPLTLTDIRMFDTTWGPAGYMPISWKWSASGTPGNWINFPGAPFPIYVGSNRDENATITMSKDFVTIPGAQYTISLRYLSVASYTPGLAFGPAGQTGTVVQPLAMQDLSTPGTAQTTYNVIATSSISTVTITLQQTKGDVLAYFMPTFSLAVLPPCVSKPCGPQGTCVPLNLKTKYRCTCEAGYWARGRVNTPCEDFCVNLAKCPTGSTCSNKYNQLYPGTSVVGAFVARVLGTDCTCDNTDAVAKYKNVTLGPYSMLRLASCT